MRDSSSAIGNNALISKMASKVRTREAIIMKSIFTHHPLFSVSSVDSANPLQDNNLSFEGGDIIVLRDDILVIGLSQRTNSFGIDFIIEHFKKNQKKMYIIVQELPDSPESFIHLDMAFTCLDIDKYLVYKPLILDANRFYTILITIDNGQVKRIEERNNILEILKSLKLDAEPIFCGGNNDTYIQEREQWHSGANFFAISPGKILGYNRNIYTIEALSKAGFEVIEANDIISENKAIENYSKCVIVFEGSELARGGGGARCMTMPLRRKNINW
jgi:arginine deiminase